MPLMNFFKRLCGQKGDETTRKKRTARSKKSAKDKEKEKTSKLLVDSDTTSSDEVIFAETESDSSSNSGGKGKGFQGVLLDSSSDNDSDKTKKKRKKRKSGKGKTSKKEAEDDNKNNTKSNKNVNDFNPIIDSESTVSSTEKNNKGSWLGSKGSNVKIDSLKKPEPLGSGPDKKKNKSRNAEYTNFKNMIIDSNSSVSTANQKNKKGDIDIVNFTSLLKDSDSSASATKQKNKKNNIDIVNFTTLVKDSDSSASATNPKSKKSITDCVNFSSILKDSDSSASATNKKSKKSCKDNMDFTTLLKDSDSSASATNQKSKKSSKDNMNFTSLLKDSDSSASATKQKTKKNNIDIVNFTTILKDSDSSASATNQKLKRSSKDNMNFTNLLKDSDSSASATNQKSKKSSKDNLNFTNLLKDSDSSASATNQKSKKSTKDNMDFTNLLKDSDSSASATNQKSKKSNKNNMNFTNFLKDSDSSASATNQKSKKSNKDSVNLTNQLRDSNSSASATNQKTKKSNNINANFFGNLLKDSDSSNSADRDKGTRETTGNDLNACDIHTLTYIESSICGNNNIKTASKDKKGNSANSNIDITLKDSDSSANKTYSPIADSNDTFQVDKPLSGTRRDEESKFRNNISVSSDFGGNNMLIDLDFSNYNETGEKTQQNIKTIDDFKGNNDIINVQDFPFSFYPLRDLESCDGGKEIRPLEKEPRKADGVVEDNIDVNGSSMIPCPLDYVNYTDNHRNDKGCIISEPNSNKDERPVAPNLIENSKSSESLEAGKETERPLNKSYDMSKNNNDFVRLSPPPHLLGDSEPLHNKDDDSKNIDNDEIYTAVHKKIYLGMDDGSPLFKDLNLSTPDNHEEKATNDDLEINIDLISDKQLKNFGLSAIYFDRTSESRKIDYISIISRQIHDLEPKLENKNDSTYDNSGNLLEVPETAERDEAVTQTEIEDVHKIEDNVDNSLKPPDLKDDSKPSDYNIDKNVISIQEEDERPESNSPLVDSLETLQVHETPKPAVEESSYVNKPNNFVNEFDSLEIFDVSESSESDSSSIFDQTVLLIDKKHRSGKTRKLLRGSEPQNSDQTTIETIKESKINNAMRQNIFAVNNLLSGFEFSDSNKNDNGDTRVMSINKMHEVAGGLNLLKESHFLDSNTVDRETDKEYGIAELSNMFKSLNLNEYINNDTQNSFTAINDNHDKNNQLNSVKDPDLLPKDIDHLKPKSSSVEDEASMDKPSIKDDNLKEVLNQSNSTADEQEHSHVAKTLKDLQLVSNDQESQIQELSDTELNLDDICIRKYLKLTHSIVGNHTERKSEKLDDNSKNNNVIIIENFISPSAISNDQESDIAIENVDMKTANPMKNTESLINESNNTADENENWKISKPIEEESPEQLESCEEESDEKVVLAANYLREGSSPDNAGKQPDTKYGNVNDESKSNEIIDMLLSLSTLNNNEKDDNYILKNNDMTDVEPLENTELLLNQSNTNGNSNIIEPLEDSSLLSGDTKNKLKIDFRETFILVCKSLPITFKSSQYDGVDKSMEAKSEKVETINNGNDNDINWDCVDEKTSTNENSNAQFSMTLADPESKCTNDKDGKIKDMDEMCEFCGNYNAKDLKSSNHNEENIRIESPSERVDNVCKKPDNIIEKFVIALTNNNETEAGVTFANSAIDNKPLEDSFFRKSDSFVQAIDSKSSSCSKKGRLKKDDGKNGNLGDKYSLIDLKALLTNEIKKELVKKTKDNILMVNKLNMPLELFNNSEYLEIDADGIELKKDDSPGKEYDVRIADKEDGLNIKTDREAENAEGKKEETNFEKDCSHSDENADDDETRHENDVPRDSKN